MSSAREIYNGGFDAPADAAANTAFHQEIIDRLQEGARGYGWRGADFCWYRRTGGTVCIGIREAESWPGLAELRAFREAQRAEAERAAAERAAAENSSSSLQQGSLL